MEVQPLPTDGELKHLFTKTLIQEDMHARDFTLLGDSNDYSANLPTPICNEIVTREYCKPGCIHQIKDW